MPRVKKDKRKEPTFNNKETYQYTFEEVKAKVMYKIKLFKKAGISYKEFCALHKLSYETFIMFKNDKLLDTTAQNFVTQIIEAFDIKVKTTSTIIYELDKELTEID